MIEADIKDRIPTYPGRVELKPVDGQPNVYDMTRADAPIEEGTPINKATIESFATSRLTGRYYQLEATHVFISESAANEYGVDIYKNEFVADKVPAVWDIGQRIIVQTPALPAHAVIENTFSGLQCNTILQPLKRYELVYNGNSFDVREV